MIQDLIIIGGGPAGIAAGIYGARKKIKTLVVAKDFLGQASRAFMIENYPGFEKISGLDLMKRFKDHLKRFEVEIKEGKEVIDIAKQKDKTFEIILSGGEKLLSKTLIIASGSNPRPLKITGEKEFLGRGVSYCVVCEGVLFQGKRVAVIGGGNSGFEAALELSRYCKKVYILHYKSKPKADELAQERVAKTKNIELLLNADAKEIKGKKFVEALVYEDLEKKKLRELTVQAVFIQIGLVPAVGFVKGLVEFNQWEEIVVDPGTCATKTPGLFAAGDVTDTLFKQVIIAAAQGAKAALSAYKYLQNQ